MSGERTVVGAFHCVHRRIKLGEHSIALILAIGSLALVATACGGSDDDSAETIVDRTQAADSESESGAPQRAAPPGLIAYMTDRAGGEGIWLIRSDDSGDHQIATDLPGEHLHPDWSPDGKHLLFTQRAKKDILFEADASGKRTGEVLACADPCIGDDEASYSPDGSRIAFVRALGPFENDFPKECLLDIHDRPSRELTELASYRSCLGRAWVPRWSPDGATLVYHRDKSDTAGVTSTAAVFSIPTAGGEERQLTPWKLAAGDPDWSPDGKRIVFSTHPLSLFQSGGVSNLYTIRPDGSDLEALTSYEDDTERASHPRYTPDAKHIVYVKDTGNARELWLMDADGSNRVQITSAGIYTHPVWKPGS